LSEFGRTAVEEELSSEIIYSIGNYVQLCARIEDLIACSIGAVESLEGAEAERLQSELRLKPTRDLIKAIKVVSERLPDDHIWAEFFNELRPYLHRFVENRHKAVHGVVSSSEGLKVKFFNKAKGCIELSDFDRNEVDMMVQNADKIARALNQFCHEIETRP